ncbi:AAA family ATPase, partial [bacterium]|nr:AAA family ATPase [bacterium]
MGIYVNPGNENLKIDLNSQIFVDKSLFIKKISEFINTDNRFICVSRPRRFGKTRVGSLMKAYFSKGCDSMEIFENLKIANPPKDDTQSENAQKNSSFDFKENLNKFNVLSIDLGAMFSSSKNKDEVLANLYDKLLEDFREEFPDIEFSEKDSVSDLIMKVHKRTDTKFVIIIDEYDVLVRERIPEDIFKEYLELLNSLFKNNELSPAIALAYLTGILPIVRDKVQSKLNVFKESTMLEPFGMEEFFGFTKAEVKALCREYKMKFKECEEWYDGYKIGKISVYNPNSLVEAMMRRECANYWQATGSYEVVSDYIKLDYDGTKSAVLEMLSDREVPVTVVDFKNKLDEIKTKDNVLTYLIHLGYLNYDKKTKLCRIPNKEIKQEWESAIKDSSNFAKIAEMIKDSDNLLYLVQNGESKEVAAALDKAHTEVASALNYNFESSLQAAIMLAF